MAYCRNCYKELGFGEIVCTGCGKKIDTPLFSLPDDVRANISYTANNRDVSQGKNAGVQNRETAGNSTSQSTQERKTVYCRNCGAQVPDNAVVCMNCGCAINSTKTVTSAAIVQPKTSKGFKIFVIIAVGFLAIIIGFAIFSNISDPEKYAVNCCKDYLEKVSNNNKGSASSFSYSEPEFLDSTGNIYYFYVEMSSTVMSSTINSGTIIVIRIDGMIKANDYTYIADVPLGDTDKSKLDERLKVIKQMYDNRSTK